METRIKISQLTQQHQALLSNFGRKSLAANILGSESVANHNIALFLFDNQIWFNYRQQIIQHGTSCLPVINRSSEFLFARPSIARVFGSAKSILKPYYELFIAACNLEHRMPLIAVTIFSLFCMANIYTSLTVYKASEISDFCNRMISLKVNNFTHMNPFINYYTVINEKVHAERLNEKATKVDAIV